jgi:hypothetical protein
MKMSCTLVKATNLLHTSSKATDCVSVGVFGKDDASHMTAVLVEIFG